jgi:MYXO-CTERM domain-containing protein
VGIVLAGLAAGGSAQAERRGGILRVDQPPPLAPIGPNDKLKYYGGRVISNVEIVEISWNASVDQMYMQKLQGFYTTIVKSPFLDWMQEYDTIGKVGYADMMAGTNQHIGRGTFGTAVVITPTNQSTALDDKDIQVELLAQLMAQKLPAPKTDAGGNVNTLYMIDFPPGISITLEGIHSCSNFGAYHFTVTSQGKSVPYGVHPSCGYSFDTSTWIHSHELAEAMTDMEVGLVEYNFMNPSARPLAWVTLANTAWQSLESGDLCNGQTATVSGYVVQKIWSNFAQACVAQIPICDGMLMQPACRPCTPYDSGNACSGASPACATQGAKVGQCVPCTSQYPKACMDPTPACDDATYTCVECVTDPDCKSTAPICENQKCRGCKVDAECSPFFCDVPSGQCVQCTKDADCPTGQQCQNHICIDIPDSGVATMPDGGTGPGDKPGVASGCGCNTSRPADGWIWIGLGALAIGLRRRRK